MSILRTHPAFTRVGPQCAVCSAWRMPCPACRISPAAVVSEAAMLRILVSYEQPIAEEMATEIVRTGVIDDRITRARKAIWIMEV